MRPLKSIWWMDLKLVCGGDNEVWFNNMVEWRFGNGMLTRVWEDDWLSEGSLKNTFPRVFLNSKQKRDVVRNMERWDQGCWAWEFQWRRQWFEWEKELVEGFYSVLEWVTLRYQEDDTWIWVELASNVFTAKSTYFSLYKMQFESSKKENFKCLWHLKFPPKVAFFI